MAMRRSTARSAELTRRLLLSGGLSSNTTSVGGRVRVMGVGLGSFVGTAFSFGTSSFDFGTFGTRASRAVLHL